MSHDIKEQRDLSAEFDQAAEEVEAEEPVPPTTAPAVVLTKISFRQKASSGYDTKT